MSLGVKNLQQISNKHYDIPVRQNSFSASFRWIKTKELGQTNSRPMNMRLYRPISKYLTTIKIQGKRTADGANKSTTKQLFGKASGTKERDPQDEKCMATDTYSLFLLQERCFSSPGRNILSFLPILG